MKTGLKTTTFLVLLFCAHLACADTMSDGLKRAKSQNKEVVMYIYSQYCPYCDAMDRNVLNDSDVSQILKRDFVYIRADIDKRPDLARKYQIRGYPTTILMESGGRTIARIPGYIPKKDFQKILAYLKGKHYRTMSLIDFLEGSG
jgi:thioredoxin-related protein